MRLSRTRAAALWLAALVGCSAGSPGVVPSASPSFDESALIDVLAPDSIRAIDDPLFERAEAAVWLEPQDPVVAVEHEGEARAYPLAILTFHEIVNDHIGSTPVAVTYCPLCNSAITYDRTAGARVLTFGVSGKLYHSDLVMFDRETTSLWPQIGGVAVRGPLAGTELETIPSSMVSFEDFTARFPEGRVLRRPAGTSQSRYGLNPYPGYDAGDGPTESFFVGRVDERLPAMERVVGVSDGSIARAYPYERLVAARAVNDSLGGEDLVVLWGGRAASALDGELIAEGATVGASGVFRPEVDGRRLTFRARGDAIVDAETGSTWTHLGEATGGPLEGATLAPVAHLDAFWFAWAAFVPHTQVWSG